MRAYRNTALFIGLVAATMATGCGKGHDDGKAPTGAAPQTGTQAAAQATTATKAATVVGLADQYEGLIKKSPAAAPSDQLSTGYTLKADGGCKVAQDYLSAVNSTNGLHEMVDLIDSTEAMCKVRNLTEKQCKKAQKLAAQIQVRARKLMEKCAAPRGDARSAAQLIKDSIGLREALQVTPPSQKKAAKPAAGKGGKKGASAHGVHVIPATYSAMEDDDQAGAGDDDAAGDADANGQAGVQSYSI